MADGSSIHTEKWIYGLSLNPEFDLYLLTMNPSGVRDGIEKNPSIRNIFRIYSDFSVKEANNYWYIMNLPKISRVVMELKPDVISTIYLTSYGLAGALVKGNSLLSHFMIGSDIMVTPKRGLLYRLLTKFALHRGDFFVSSSKTMTNALLDLHSIPTNRLLTQQYGVGEEVINYAQQAKEYDFISNRAWVPNSNIPFMLDIFKQMRSLGKCAIIGQGGEQEKIIEEYLAQLPNVKRLGALPYMENIHAVAQSRYYISLTSSDGASLSLMEAMALGVVPVVSNIAPNLEWIEDGFNGFVIDISNIAETIQKFEYIAQLSEEQRITMSARNVAIISDRGRLVINMKKYADHLLSLLEHVKKL
jgi:glycosyltransferase involved in cell wall biosynthesis